MVWLPKPSKKPTEVSNLRPLALAEPIGKVVISLVAKTAVAALTDRLCRLPQFAYMAHRGAQDALRRVTLHCHGVDELISRQQNSILNKRDQYIKLDCCGGVQVCLDLSRAFDQADRTKLIHALRRLGAGVTSALCFNAGTMARDTSSTRVALKLLASPAKVFDRAALLLQPCGVR